MERYGRIMEGIEKATILAACLGVLLELGVAGMMVWDIIANH